MEVFQCPLFSTVVALFSLRMCQRRDYTTKGGVGRDAVALGSYKLYRIGSLG